MRTATTEDLTTPRRQRGWRVVDIVVAAVLGVAAGLVFWLWDGPGYSLYAWFDTFTPGLGGLANGMWFLGGLLGAAVIRKPGAALFTELVAAVVEAALGNQWGWNVLWSGLAQGLGAELVLALFLYRRWNAAVLMLAGVGAAVGAWVREYITDNFAKSATFNSIYLVCSALSGAVLAGLLAWLLTRALAATGALDRFPSGRARR